MITHDEIRDAAIATLKADGSANAVIKAWYRYLLPMGTIRCPAFYVGDIVQPLNGACGTYQQYTTTDYMNITTGVLCDKYNKGSADTELGTVYGLVYDAFQATPTLGLDDFKIHSITPITTKTMPQYGKLMIGAEIILNASWEE